MKLYTALRAPNPRRVEMFIAEKGIDGIERVVIDLNAGGHKDAALLARNPFATLPVLELDDGRMLAESRAICSYLEAKHPEPNLLGRDAEERAFIEMIDRQIEFHFFVKVMNCLRHTHPGFSPLEQPQFAEFGASQGEKMRAVARHYDNVLAGQAYFAGERFSIADITAFCAVEFARLMKFRPAHEGLTHLQAWRDRVAERPSAHV